MGRLDSAFEEWPAWFFCLPCPLCPWILFVTHLDHLSSPDSIPIAELESVREEEAKDSDLLGSCCVSSASFYSLFFYFFLWASSFFLWGEHSVFSTREPFQICQ